MKTGLVPTMGALHAGHRALLRAARAECDRVVMSLFVNPTQFGPGEDLDRYPRDEANDRAIAAEEGADEVYAPTAAEMYPDGFSTTVSVGELGHVFEGAARPGHFDGVATIVTKLFAATGPAVAVFGRKDYQQLQVVKRLARDLLLPIEVVGLATVRDPDGLALSSRNAYLAVAERERALAIPRGIAAALTLHAAGERNAGKLRRAAVEPIAAAATRIDYVTVAGADDLRPFADTEAVGERAVVAVAAFVGGTRLIDNAVFGEDNIR